MSAPDFSSRARLSEWMDDDAVDFETFRACLADLAKVNMATLAYRPTLRFLADLAKSGRWPIDRPLQILDIGSGYGDALRVIDRWARRRGLAVTLAGLDRNPWAAGSAAAVTDPSRPIAWVTSDLFDLEGGADVIISSLFTHHLDDPSLVRFLGWMDDRARIGWFVNDLLRDPVAYHGFRALSWLMRWHRFVRHDGPISIRRAFVESDWREYLTLAGVHGATVSRRFPFRLCVSKRRRA
jgi:SAM-dependent methyltransferase